jgi:hypothetical protein
VEFFGITLVGLNAENARKLILTVALIATDNWLELSLRFIARASGTRDMKDKMSREILSAFEEAGIGIASATYDIVGFPPIRVENARHAT